METFGRGLGGVGGWRFAFGVAFAGGGLGAPADGAAACGCYDYSEDRSSVGVRRTAARPIVARARLEGSGTAFWGWSAGPPLAAKTG